jgi:hypothetical protein
VSDEEIVKLVKKVLFQHAGALHIEELSRRIVEVLVKANFVKPQQEAKGHGRKSIKE